MQHLEHGFHRPEERSHTKDNAVPIAHVGLGHIYSYHGYPQIEHPGIRLRAVADLDPNTYQSHTGLREIPYYADAEELLDAHPDIRLLAISVPSKAKALLMKLAATRGVGVFVEKPATANPQEFQDVLALDPLRKLVMEGANHAAYNYSVKWMQAQLRMCDDGSIAHPEHGKLKHVKLEKYDPYVKDGCVPYAPESSSGKDAWPNIMAELAAYVGSNFSVTDAKYLATDVPGCEEAKAEIRGEFMGGEFEGHTDWTRNSFAKGTSEKTTTLIFEDGYAFRMELVPQEIYGIPQYTGRETDIRIPLIDFMKTPGRMRMEYWQMYCRLVEVAAKVVPDNRDFVLKYLTEMQKADAIARRKIALSFASVSPS